MIKALNTEIHGVKILEPQVYHDDRGFFFESFHHAQFEAAIGRNVTFVQDNHSRSKRHVLRGLHYQLPHAQGKLVRAVVGEIFDVVVDLRRSSPTCGHWFGLLLSAENKRQLWCPEGLAHGFITLSEHAEILYKTTNYWYPDHEHTLFWNDPDLAIAWPMAHNALLSRKDAEGVLWKEAFLYD